MKKILKVLIGIVVAVLVLFAAAALIVSLLDANKFRPQITAKVKEATGRELTVGDIHLSLFPVVGARLKQVTLSNAQGFGDTPMAQIGEAEVGVRLLPLIFSRRVEVARIYIADAKVDLAVGVDGRNNWSDISEHAAQKAPSIPQKVPAEEAEKGGPPLALTVGSVEIKNAAVSYADRKAGKSYKVDNFHLKTGAIDIAKPFDFSLGFVTQVSQPAMTADIETSGRASIDTAKKAFSVEGFQLSVDGKGAALPNGKLALKLTAGIDAAADAANLRDFKLKLDDTNVSGSFALTSISKLAMKFALNVDQFDLDRYLPPEKKGSEAAAKPEAPAAGGKSGDQTPIPVDALDGFSAEGTLDIGKLKAKGVTATDVRLQVHAVKGAEKRAQLAAKFYGGSVGSTTVITPGATPRYAQAAKLENINVGPLLMDFMGKDKVSGNGNINLNVTTAGHTVGDVKRALNGDVAVALKNGAVKGFNLAHIIRQGQALLNGQQLQENEPQQTDFSAITASGKFIDGVLHSDQLDANAPLLRVNGAGTVDIVHQTIDYVAKPTVVNTTSAQGGKELANLNGVTVPIHVTGTFDQPKYSLDLKTAVKQKAVEKLTNKLTEQLDKKNPGLADQLRGFGGLFGKKQQPPAQQPATNPPSH